MSVREAKSFSEKQTITGEITTRTWRAVSSFEGMEKLV
jgi:hypothetical protein